MGDVGKGGVGEGGGKGADVGRGKREGGKVDGLI